MYQLSIITINRNNAEGLRKTIRSVISQSCKEFEYLVIDGASTDESVDIIKDFSSYINHWTSEPDSGLYNAMNKGVKMATGEYLFFLNSGDSLCDSLVIEKLINEFKGEDVVYGDILVKSKEKSMLIKSPNKVNYYKKYQHHLPPQPATIIKRALFDKVGLFDESYRIIADVVLISRLFSSKEIRYKYIDLAITNFDTGGVSSKNENQDKIYKERKRFIWAEFPQYADDFEKVYQKSLVRSLFSFLKRRIKVHI